MSLRRSLAWSFIGQALTYLVTFASSIALARMLTPGDMGIFAFGFALWSITSQLQNLGLPGYIVSERQLSVPRLGSIFLVNSISSLIVFLVVVVTSVVLKENGSIEIATVLAILAPIPLFRILDLIPYAMLHRALLFREMAAVQILQSLVGAATAVTMAYAGFGFVSMAWGNLLGSFAAMFVSIIFGWSSAHFWPGAAAIREVTRFGLGMFFVLGMENISSRLNDIFVGRLQNYALLGFYSRATSMITLVNEGLFGFVVRVLFPALANHERAFGDLREPYMRCCKVITGIMWPAWGGLATIAAPLIIVLFGQTWAPSAPVLSLLCAAQIPLGALPLHRDLFIIKGRTAWQMQLEPIFTIASLAIFFLACLKSLEAAAASRILIGFVWMGVYWRPVLTLSGLSWADLVQVYRQSAILTLAAVFPSLLINFVFKDSNQDRVLILFFSVGLSMLTWAIAGVLLRHQVFKEISRLHQHIQAR